MRRLVVLRHIQFFLLGEQHGNVISQYAAMGGGSTSLNSMKTINPFNPATYSYINSNSFCCLRA